MCLGTDKPITIKLEDVVRLVSIKYEGVLSTHTAVYRVDTTCGIQPKWLIVEIVGSINRAVDKGPGGIVSISTFDVIVRRTLLGVAGLFTSLALGCRSRSLRLV